MGKFKDFMGGTGAGLLNEASKNLAKNNMEIMQCGRACAFPCRGKIGRAHV